MNYFLKFDQYLLTSSSSPFNHFYLGLYLSRTVRTFNSPYGASLFAPYDCEWI